jgi:bacterioferritin
MFAIRSDQKVLGYLGRALSLELSAVQQYSTQARLVASWGLSEAAASLRKEADEELKHADRIIERMLAIGVAPGGSQLRAVQLATDLSGLLLANQQFEADVIQLYRSAAGHCASVGDHDSRVFFEELLKEEQQHLAELDAWLQQLQQLPQKHQASQYRNRGRR